jgi:hypothetical protein
MSTRNELNRMARILDFMRPADATLRYTEIPAAVLYAAS